MHNEVIILIMAIIKEYILLLAAAHPPDGIHPNVIEREIHIPLYGIERPPLLKVI